MTDQVNSIRLTASNGNIIYVHPKFINQVNFDKNGYAFSYSMSWLHRENGPAILLEDGGKVWYLDGELHRVDGPAVEWAGQGPRDEDYYLYGTYYYTKEDWKKEVAKLQQKTNSLDGKIATIDGKTYRLVEIN